MARITAVCKSEKRGTVAKSILRKDYGLMGDARVNYGTHHQVSLSTIESIAKVQQQDFGAIEILPKT